MRSAAWAGIPRLSVRTRPCPMAWQQCWQSAALPLSRTMARNSLMPTSAIHAYLVGVDLSLLGIPVLQVIDPRLQVSLQGVSFGIVEGLD
jgi:hypothetical protein